MMVSTPTERVLRMACPPTVCSKKWDTNNLTSLWKKTHVKQLQTVYKGYSHQRLSSVAFTTLWHSCNSLRPVAHKIHKGWKDLGLSEIISYRKVFANE